MSWGEELAGSADRLDVGLEREEGRKGDSTYLAQVAG